MGTSLSEVGAAFFQRHFEFLDEQALAAHLGQRAVQDLVALGGHAQQLHLVAPGPQQRLHMLGLPQRQLAFARGDHDGVGDKVSGIHQVSRG
jgi:hypothetical protein